jgi:hypothetical protein
MPGPHTSKRPDIGSEAAEPSPGHSDNGTSHVEPSKDDLERAEHMYRKAAKKLAEEPDAELDKQVP